MELIKSLIAVCLDKMLYFAILILKTCFLPFCTIKAIWMRTSESVYFSVSGFVYSPYAIMYQVLKEEIMLL